MSDNKKNQMKKIMTPFVLFQGKTAYAAVISMLFVLPFALSSCFGKKSGANNNSGGVNEYLSFSSKGRPNEYYRIPGMVYIPTGAMLIGANDDGVYGNFFALKNRQITINGFWMDETEITNDMYKGFVRYVHDYSVAKALKLYVKQEDPSASKKDRAAQASSKKGRRAVRPNDNGRRALNNNATNQAAAAKPAAKPIDSTPDLSKVAAALQDLNNLQKLRDSGIYFYNAIERAYRPNYSNIKYAYYQFSLTEASLSKEEFSEKNLIKNYKAKNISVFPDTTVWIKDISYSYNEPMAIRYFSAVNYRNYPVVGVTWDQAKAFCNWRTTQTVELIKSNPRTANLAFDASFRLPTESEWEYAARGGRSGSLYPWGGPYTTNKLGCFLANFKNQRGIYMEDGYAYTCDVRSYWPNDFGLYNMAGNVSEWTESIFSNDAYVYVSDINPSLSDVDLNIIGDMGQEDKQNISRRKVIRGGSWKDVAAFIQNGYRAYESQDQARSYIGFRTVIDLPPTSF